MSENTTTATETATVAGLINLTDVSADANAGGCCGGGSCGA